MQTCLSVCFRASCLTGTRTWTQTVSRRASSSSLTFACCSPSVPWSGLYGCGWHQLNDFLTLPTTLRKALTNCNAGNGKYPFQGPSQPSTRLILIYKENYASCRKDTGQFNSFGSSTHKPYISPGSCSDFSIKSNVTVFSRKGCSCLIPKRGKRRALRTA